MIPRACPVSSARRLRSLNIILLLLAGMCLPVSAEAGLVIQRVTFEQTKTEKPAQYPSNEEFARWGVTRLADSLLSEFQISRPRPIWIGAAEGETVNPWFEDTTARLLYDRGFVVRERPDADSLDEGLWSVRYRFDRFVLTMPRAKRHSFLGKIWVERQFEASLYLSVWDGSVGELVWSGSEEIMVTDWVPKSDIRTLSAGVPSLLNAEIPTTREERLVEPVLIGAAVGALTVLFFAVR